MASWALLPLLALACASPSGAQGSTVPVRSGRALAAALADPSVSSARVEVRYLALVEDDWADYGRVNLARNFTIFSANADPLARSVLDFGQVSGKVRREWANAGSASCAGLVQRSRSAPRSLKPGTPAHPALRLCDSTQGPRVAGPSGQAHARPPGVALSRLTLTDGNPAHCIPATRETCWLALQVALSGSATLNVVGLDLYNLRPR